MPIWSQTITRYCTWSNIDQDTWSQCHVASLGHIETAWRAYVSLIVSSLVQVIACHLLSALPKLSWTCSSMVQCKTAITPVHEQWSYCTLALSHHHDLDKIWVLKKFYAECALHQAITWANADFSLVRCVALTGESYNECQSYDSVWWVWKLYFKNDCHVSQGSVS